MNRRQFLKSTGGVIAASSLISATTRRSNPTDIETSIFIDESVDEWFHEPSKEDILETSYDLLENAISPIDSSHNIFRTTPDVHTVDMSEYGIQTEGQPEEILNIYNAFQSHLFNNVDEKHISDHSNILILGSNTFNYGMGTLPDPCMLSFGHRISVIPINSVIPDLNSINRYNTTAPGVNRFVTALIHEFGHNLGLDHDHGKFIRHEDDKIYVTPMLSEYVCHNNYTGQLNQYLQEIPCIDNCDANHIMTRTTFNEETSSQQIRDSCFFNPDVKPVWDILS